MNLISDKANKPTLSIVVPLFNEEKCVPILVAEITNVLESLKEPYEIILVDDGSQDSTWDKIKIAAGQDKRVKGISLSRKLWTSERLACRTSSCLGTSYNKHGW